MKITNKTCTVEFVTNKLIRKKARKDTEYFYKIIY